MRLVSRPGTRFRKVMDECKNKKICEIDAETGVGCGQPQPRYTKVGLGIQKDDPSGAVHGGQGSMDTRQSFQAEDARAILSKIRDEDIRLMGMDPK